LIRRRVTGVASTRYSAASGEVGDAAGDALLAEPRRFFIVIIVGIYFSLQQSELPRRRFICAEVLRQLAFSPIVVFSRF